jgi:hypothetical protein
MAEPPNARRVEASQETPRGTARRPERNLTMLSNFEFAFNEHKTRVRRAEEKARLLAAVQDGRPAKNDRSASRRVSVILRRLAGTAASA